MNYADYLKKNVAGKTGVVKDDRVFVVGPGVNQIMYIGEDFVSFCRPGNGPNERRNEDQYVIPLSQLIVRFP